MVGWECPTNPREASGLDPEAVHEYENWNGEVVAAGGSVPTTPTIETLATANEGGGFGSIRFENKSNGNVVRADICRLQGLYNCSIPSSGYHGVGTSKLSGPEEFVVRASNSTVKLYKSSNLSIGNSSTIVIDNESKVSGTVFSTLSLNSSTNASINGSLRVSTNITSDSSVLLYGTIDASGLGYPANQGPCPGTNSAGAGHGGRGGNSSIDDGADGVGGCTYGDVNSPTTFGSGGSNDGGDGGGRVRVQSKSVTIEGRIKVNGRDAPGGARGGGAGGSVLVNATTISGSGNISADGGDGKTSGFDDQGGGGGGGRVAIVGDTFSGNVSVDGGFGPKKAENGSDGTYYNP